MQPPPRTGPPGASGPPPSGPNMFRRTRPYKHAAAAPATMPPVAQPMTDPFAFSRAPPPMAAGGLPTVSNSNPAPVQTPSNAMYHQPGSGLPPQPQTLEGATGAASGVTLFNPHSTPPLGPTGYISSHNEQGYFNSREQIPSASTESAPMATASEPSQTPLNPEFQGQSGPLPVPFQPLPPVTTSSSQWAPDHGSRPPSVQNYFQPTSDPVPQPFNMPLQTQMYPSHSPSPLHNTPTPPTQPAHLQNQASLPFQNPLKPPTSQWPDPNGPQQHNSHFQTQSYFSQSSAAPDPWFNQPPQDSGYHQMGTGMGHPQPLLDAAGSQPATSTGPGPGAGPSSSSSTVPAPLPHSQESGTLSMFFKDNDVENEEMLSGERNKAVNGIAGTFQLHSNQQSHSSHADVSSDYQGAFLQDHSQLPYMIDGNQPSQGNAQKPSDSQFDHVENLECVPNQEVLPSEIHSSPASTAPHSAEQFETGPNLETPDSIPRPMRSASVSSNYSNMSHGSGTGTRRHQGVVGTFIQQESSRLSDDPNQPVAAAAAAAGGYFEQIDTSPAGDVGVQQSSLEQMWPPTPSPPKPTGIFQASANSSFEPVRSHGVGVRPAEIDRAKMVAEGGADCAPGNMEQPPDNMENVYGSGHPLPAGAGGGVPPLTHPVVYSHSRPSSRAHGVNQPCESPATTLWAQNDPTTLGANILLAPAAPIVLAPLREPSADVIQPPEDGPLDLQPSQRTQPPSHQHSENLENPPKVSEAEPSDSQGNLGYASLLVSGSLHQPVFIAPPVSNYSVIPPSTVPQAATQSSLRETTPPVRLIAQGQGPTTSQPASLTCNQNPLFSPGILSFNVSASNQSPLNLTRDNTAATTSEITASPHPQPVRPPLSRGTVRSVIVHACLMGKRKSKFSLQHFTHRKTGYEDQWQYYPGYDASFDEDYRRQGDAYGDDFDRRSVHSEQSVHSVHSSHSHHSRRSSFSSRSQQSQVYRSQPDLVSAAYDNTSSTLAVDYSYGQYPDQTDASHNYSQYYPSGYTTETPPRPATPEKFTIPHRCARFGPGGHLVQVLPNLPSAGQPALVDIHNLETMLQDTTDQAELRAFPGPLVKEETHKVDVIKFSQNKALECSRDNNLLDRDSARLLWDFIMLLCRQNGTVVGTDIADLLLKEHRSVWLPGKSPNEANLIDFNNEPLARAEEEPGAGPLSLLSDTFMTVPENFGKETERFRELLLFGRKKDALEAAMKGGLWGHALLLASKMDNRTHARVMTRFANSLPINDPLQTVYQLMSGRMPASATCCGEEKWGDWRPHLAMVLSNLTHTLDLDTRTITTMGDTLASKGLVDAAHFCYLMAQVGLGVFTKKSTKMVLIGSNHSLPFSQFATNEAIQRTEAYEYAQSLGSQPCSLPNFQVFKLIYACRLAEAGLSAQAFHYCEVISKTVLMQPSYYSPVFISQIIQMSEKLRFFDPQLKEKPEQELFIEPEWLIRLRQLDGQIKTGLITYNADRTTPTQFECSSPSSDLDHPSPPNGMSLDNPAPDNPLMSSLLPGSPPQGVQLMPPGLFGVFFFFLGAFGAFFIYLKSQAHLKHAVSGGLCISFISVFSVIQSSGRRSRTTSESSTHSGGRERSNSTVVQASPPPPSIPEQPIKEEAKKVKKDSPKKKGVGWLGWIIGKGKNEAHLPDDKNKSIVWDEKKQRWVDLNEPEEESKPPPPPPSVFPKMPQVPGPGGPPAPPSSGPPVNMFSRKSRYVDVLNPSRAAKPGGPAPAPADIFAPLAPMPIPTNLFVPSSGVEGGNQEQNSPNTSAGPQVSLLFTSNPQYSL
uniref:Protein transport protein sec16 n=1 Tax=Oreochromis niloticus TaxID=8128 RepID=A0A669F3U4_ORENI